MKLIQTRLPSKLEKHNSVKHKHISLKNLIKPINRKSKGEFLICRLRDTHWGQSPKELAETQRLEKVNSAMLAAMEADTDCFTDPAWPGKVCQDRVTTKWVQSFIKFYLGVAGKRPDDIDVIGRYPPQQVGKGEAVSSVGDTMKIRYSLRGWVGDDLTGGEGKWSPNSAQIKQRFQIFRDSNAKPFGVNVANLKVHFRPP